jgi:hypothetical protein
LISGKGETSSRLPAFSLFLPGSCPNYRDRRSRSGCSSRSREVAQQRREIIALLPALAIVTPLFHRQDLAGDHAGFVAGEIERHARDVLGLDQPEQVPAGELGEVSKAWL